MDEHIIEVGFGLAWDADGIRIVRQVSREAAREMHAAGDPYCVLHSNQAGLPLLLTRVDTGAGYLGHTVFDAEGRPGASMDYRRFGDVLALRVVEFHPHGEDGRFSVRIPPDGAAESVLASKTGSLHQQPRIPAEHRVVAEPEFDALVFDERWFDVQRPEFVDAPSAEPAALDDADQEARWSPPDLGPARPHNLQALFTPGSAFLQRLEHGLGGGSPTTRLWTVCDIESAGHVSLPTGRVVATDPGLVDEDSPAFTVAVAPGRYPVYLAKVSEGEDPWPMVAAAKLEISGRPTATWELALCPGQDVALLGKGQFYGFGVDTGTGAFLDHSGRAAFVGSFEQAFDYEDEDEDRQSHPDGVGAFHDRQHGTGTNMITFLSGYGDGAYPVWIGRDEEGGVTCFVADMGVVGSAEPLTPGPDAEPRHIEPPCADRSAWAPSRADAVLRPSESVSYFAEMFRGSAALQGEAMRFPR